MTNDKSLLILGIDTSGEYCSVGLVQGGKILGEISLRAPQEHSSQLIPSIDKILKDSHLKIQNVDGIAISIGPGSFTGLRVGVATAKALAQGLEIPIVGVRTLDMIALNTITKNGDSPQWDSPHFSTSQGQSLICPIVDARKQQIYTAIYKKKSESRRVEESKSLKTKEIKLKKLTKDLVLTIDELISLLSTIDHRRARQSGYPRSGWAGLSTVFIGNAIPVYGDVIKEKLCVCPPGVGGSGQAIFATKELWYPRASNIAIAGLEKLQQNKKGDNLFKLKPIYLREPDIRKKKLAILDEQHG